MTDRMAFLLVPTIQCAVADGSKLRTEFIAPLGLGEGRALLLLDCEEVSRASLGIEVSKRSFARFPAFKARSSSCLSSLQQSPLSLLD